METNFPALREAIAKDPENVTLRVHLCDLLIEHGHFDESLVEIRAGLAHAPDDVALLGLATRVLNRTGNCELARRYERVLDAVIETAGVEEIPAPPSPQAKPDPATDHPRRRHDDAEPLHNRRHDDPAPEPRRRSDDPKPSRRKDDPQSTPAVSPAPQGAEAGAVVHDLRDTSVVVEDVPDPSAAASAATATPTSATPSTSGWDASIEPGRRLIEIRRPWSSLDRLAGMTKLRGDLYAYCDAPSTTKKSGLLLWGPPGCGKATFADACAGTLERQLLHVHLGEAVEAWLIKGRHELAAIFAEAEANSPCVLFLDGLDALCGHATLVSQALRDFMSRLDALVTARGDDVVVIGATHRPWLLNRHVIASHRFGTQLLVQAPDAEARGEIIRGQLADRPIDRIDLEGLAAATATYSAAELVFLCELASEYAIFDSVQSEAVRPITMQDLVRAIDETTPSTTEWFRTARGHATGLGGTNLGS